jgi:hypothetical protein
MRLRKATPKEIDFACKRFHYAKSVPAAHKYDYSIFNDSEEWCGVIVYSFFDKRLQKRISDMFLPYPKRDTQ